jgi:hypothetical protein
MILNRLRRHGGINWKYAIGEIILIFIGISLSLAFDQWRTSNSNEAKEEALLMLLTESVKKDIQALEFNIEESEKTLRSVDFLIRKLTNNSVFDDSISVAFSVMAYNPQFSADKLGYNNILAEGLPIISDNNLRTNIIQYYERADGNTAWGEGVQSHIDEYIAPRIIADFQDYNFLQKGIPFDFNKLKSDKIFINVLKKLQRLNVVSLERLKDQKRHGERFMKQLTAEGTAR